MNTQDPIRVGIIGFGFMGRTHLAAYRGAKRSGIPAEVVAVCDRGDGLVARGNLASAAGAPDLPEPARVDDPDALIARDDIQLVSICTWTDSHVDLAARALRRGRHVLVEKPVSLDPDPIAALHDLARRQGRLCMPAMCMRFWPGWDWLRRRIRDGRYGPVRSARFERLSAAPTWGGAFYHDHARSGGALFDLHIHDADFILHCFGMPASVVSAGDANHVTTLYRFGDGGAGSRAPSPVSATGAWLSTPSAPFRMRYQVEFERAVADFDLGRPAPLELADEHGVHAVALEAGTGYDGEIRALLGAIQRGDPSIDPSLEESVRVTHLLRAERDSLRTGREVAVRVPDAAVREDPVHR